MSSILLYIGLKSTMLSFPFVFTGCHLLLFIYLKMLIHLAPFISLDAQSMYI